MYSPRRTHRFLDETTEEEEEEAEEEGEEEEKARRKRMNRGRVFRGSDCFIGGIPIMKGWWVERGAANGKKKKGEKMRNKKRSTRKKWMLPG